jgi:hypothetical protein
MDFIEPWKDLWIPRYLGSKWMLFPQMIFRNVRGSGGGNLRLKHIKNVDTGA